MQIGIDASRAFMKQRTGIEEYSYQVIKHLMQYLKNDQVVLYIRRGQSAAAADCPLPDNWKVKVIKFPYLWTQLGLSLEMLLNPVDVLFVPAHTVPLIHPKNTAVVIHGLEYEFVPDAYSWWERFYMRHSIKKSCKWARKIIAVSKNTKNDLINVYKVSDDRIRVIYEGYETDKTLKNCDLGEGGNLHDIGKGYLMFVGRIEERKNIIGIMKAFEILKEKHGFAGKLVLAGRPGYGYDRIMDYLSSSKYKSEIIMSGFISDEDKCKLFGNAGVFMFPTFYEGFGIPILEAQSMGVPVVCSNISSMSEVADGSAVLVDPNEPSFIAERTNVLIKDENFRKDIIQRGYKNVERFSWDKCAQEIAEILMKKEGPRC